MAAITGTLNSPEEKLFEDNRGMPGGVGSIFAEWISTAGGGFTIKLPMISGRIVELITNPDDSAAPTQDYNVTLISSRMGHDLLEGLGADRHTSSTESTMIVKEVTIGSNTYAAPPYIDEAGAVLTVANAGNAKKGKIQIIIE